MFTKLLSQGKNKIMRGTYDVKIKIVNKYGEPSAN